MFEDILKKNYPYFECEGCPVKDIFCDRCVDGIEIEMFEDIINKKEGKKIAYVLQDGNTFLRNEM